MTEKFWEEKYSLGFLQPELTLFLDNAVTGCSIWSQMEMASQKLGSVTKLDCIWWYLIGVSIITSSKKLVRLSYTEAVFMKAQLGLSSNKG